MNSLLQNRYEILEKIGDGGMATVYRARCTLLDRIVAVKILKEEYARDAALVAKFKSEAQAAARLSHPNIVNVFDVGEDRGANFIVMEYIEGIDLKEYIQQQGVVPIEEAVRIAVMICDGVAHAHDRGLIHRDIKPHNILFTRDGTVKVADFGIARAATSATITFSGNMVGSVHYVSPEQARGEPVAKTSDIYSLGCVLYEMVTGQVPFDADSSITVALKHIHEMPTPPSAINRDVPAALEEVIMTAMEKKPVYRYQSAQEMKKALIESVYGKAKGISRKKNRNDHTIIMPSVGKEDALAAARRKKMRPMGLILVATILVGLTLGILFSLRGNIFGQEVEVPNVVGLSFKEAAQVLADNDLEMEVINRIHSEVEVEHVVSQDPEPTLKVKEGRAVQVVLSLGVAEAVVPNVVGKTLEDATLLIESEGLKLGEITRINDPDVADGVIVAQSPEKNERVDTGEKVDLTVSGGEPASGDINMPDLIGMELDAAKAKLKADGLVLESSEGQDSDEYFAGQIVSQSIPAGKSVSKGSSVSLVVSKGPGPLPKTAQLKYTLPQDQEVATLSIILVDAKGRREVYNNSHPGGYTVYRQIEFYGRGTVYYYVNGKEAERQLIE